MTDDWLAGLAPDERDEAHRLAAALARLGCSTPLAGARSEIEFDLPQVAGYRFVRGLEERVSRSLPGVDAATLVRVLLAHLADADPPPGLPSWTLTEVDPSGAPTGRLLTLTGEAS
jgi:hypothetical protein